MVIKAVLEDVEQIIQIVNCMINEEADFLINMWDKTYPTKDVFVNDIENGNLYVVKEDIAVVAFFCIDDNEPSNYCGVKFKYEKPLYIHRFCVKREYRLKEITNQMMDFVNLFAFEKGYQSLRLDTYSENVRSNKFYTNHGFKKVDIIRGRAGLYNCYERNMNIV